MVSCNQHPVGRWWKQFVIILTPLLLLIPLFMIPEETLPTQANQCLYVMILMGSYWCTEVLPLAVTALLPVFIFPMFGILTTEVVCAQYIKDTTMMFVGSITVALAVEKCNLHKRIAVNVLHLVGTKPLWLMLGFMLPTWFLSMWISNTATTAMMLPISEAVLESLVKSEKDKNALKERESKENESKVADACHAKTNYLGVVDECDDCGNGTVNADDNADDMIMDILKSDTNVHPEIMNVKQHNLADMDETSNFIDTTLSDQNIVNSEAGKKSTGNPRLDKFAKGMTLAVAYAANIGGTASLIGTAPNFVMKGHADDIWETHGYHQSPVTFASWCVMGFPMSLINLCCAWIWLTIFFNGFRALCPYLGETSDDDTAIERVIDKEYKALGKIRFAEGMVVFMFSAMVVLWFFRSPNFITGWSDGDAFIPGYIRPAVVSIFIAFMMFITPSEVPNCKSNQRGEVHTLLDWYTVEKKLPWGIVFLLGGGLCLAKASMVSGLSNSIAESLKVMADLPGWVMVLVVCLFTAFLTEFTSNTATCSILMPIVSSLASGIGRNPLYLMFPVALSTSFAFMLPVATPPNAVAFSYGRLRILDMVKAGFILNFTCVAIVTLGTHTWGDAFFNFDVIPWEANSTTTPLP